MDMSEYSIGELVVGRVAYPMRMHSTPRDFDLSNDVVWDNDMSGVVVDVIERAGIVFLKIFTSAATIGWMMDSFVKRAK